MVSDDSTNNLLVQKNVTFICINNYININRTTLNITHSSDIFSLLGWFISNEENNFTFGVSIIRTQITSYYSILRIKFNSYIGK